MFLLFTKCCLSKEKSDDITIINPNKLKGEITIKKDCGSCIPEIALCSENYFPAFARIWTSDFNTTNNMSPPESNISFEEIVLSSKSL